VEFYEGPTKGQLLIVEAVREKPIGTRVVQYLGFSTWRHGFSSHVFLKVPPIADDEEDDEEVPTDAGARVPA
jgi:hypothetical protein